MPVCSKNSAVMCGSLLFASGEPGILRANVDHVASMEMKKFRDSLSPPRLRREDHASEVNNMVNMVNMVNMTKNHVSANTAGNRKFPAGGKQKQKEENKDGTAEWQLHRTGQAEIDCGFGAVGPIRVFEIQDGNNADKLRTRALRFTTPTKDTLSDRYSKGDFDIFLLQQAHKTGAFAKWPHELLQNQGDWRHSEIVVCGTEDFAGANICLPFFFGPTDAGESRVIMDSMIGGELLIAESTALVKLNKRVMKGPEVVQKLIGPHQSGKKFRIDADVAKSLKKLDPDVEQLVAKLEKPSADQEVVQYAPFPWLPGMQGGANCNRWARRVVEEMGVDAPALFAKEETTVWNY